MVVHAVRIGQNAPPRNYEPATRAAELALALPRQAVVGLTVHTKHLHS